MTITLTFTFTRALALQSQRSLLSLSKPTQVPIASLFRTLVGPHGRYDTRMSNILQDRVGVSTNKNSPYGFRTFCSGKDLSTKKCVPCNAQDLRPMTEESANDLIPKVDGWKLLNEGGKLKLSRSWRVKSFTKGLELFKLVADVAEAEGHHPDLHLVGWNNVSIEIWTHAVGGLTENDFILASKINKLDLQNLMRRKAATTSA